MRLVAFADVQGNLPALEAILTAAKRLQPEEVVSLGNVVGAGPHGKEVVDLLRKRRVTCLAGPEEAALAEGGGAAHNVRALPARDVRALAGFPTERRLVAGGRRLHLAYSPWMTPFEPVPGDASDADAARWLATGRADVAAWAATGGPFVRELPGGGVFAAPGRAGLHPEGPEAPYLVVGDAGDVEVRHAAYDPEGFVLDMLKQELPLNGVPEPLRRRF